LAAVGERAPPRSYNAQTVPRIEDRYGHEAAISILSNCTSQLFFPLREPHAAELIGRAFGSKLELTEQMTVDSVSYGSRYWPPLEPAEVMSLPEGSLIVFSRGLRRIAQDSREVARSWLPRLPPTPVAGLAEQSVVTRAVPRKEGTDRFW
jgi:hypothetical protein